MEQKQYKVIFNGGSVPLHDVERVRNNLATLFRTDASRLSPLFQDRLVVIRKNLSLTEADHYRDAVERIGGYCIIESMDQPIEHSVLSLAPRLEKIACPKCRSVQPKAPVCRACGIVIEDYREKIARDHAQVLATLEANEATTVDLSQQGATQAQAADTDSSNTAGPDRR